MANRKRTDASMDSRRDSKKRGRGGGLDLADEIIDSDESSVNDEGSVGSSSESETDLASKKVRMAREYLERVEAGEDESSDDGVDGEEEEDDGDVVARKLRDRRLEQTGTLERQLADKVSQRVGEIHDALDESTKDQSSAKAAEEDAEREAKAWVASGNTELWRGHDLTPTCVALRSDGSRAISGSKDHSVLLWDVETSQKISFLCPHWKKQSTAEEGPSRTSGQVLSVACSDDGRYAAVGSRDAVVRIFDIRIAANGSNAAQPPNLVKEFHGHKGAITGLCFQYNAPQLFSASEDRCIRSYNTDEMVHLETLYGHQLGVTGIDCYQKELPVSVGRDRTARAWKLAEDTHMIYRGGSLLQPAESVSIVKDGWFLTGHEDGQLSLWSTEKKKPVFSLSETHGKTAEDINRSVVSVAASKRSDLALTGSSDGYVRLWRIRTAASKAEGRDILEIEQKIPIHGYVNSIAIGPQAKFALLAVGNEHRSGRWNPVKRAKNRLAMVDLSPSDDSSKASSGDEDEA
eukprot:CAMPEP_0172444308 /NCGR_PEP_ID=MMETSP1065-20121228/4367_1 /TAXON_ID=265537 /ORGANISM="Amphiprora paludosa, Strain CCMP125" /LENGTH=518 /DNA_ID=CAMNT_0013194791 /DNA_START=16 /DNA_END=1572 /DNA_ORIENTATION=-